MKTFTLDGGKIHDLESFYDETQLKLCPGFDGYGRNLDAFNDILRGGFGRYEYGEKFQLIWKNSEMSRETLGYEETLNYLSERLPKVHPTNTERWKERIRLAEQAQGQTLFDDIVGIIQQQNNHIEFVLD